MATHQGSTPTGTSWTSVLASPATLNTLTELLSGLTLHTSALSLVMAIGLAVVAEAVPAAVAVAKTRPFARSPALHEATRAIAPRTRRPPQAFRLLRIRPPFWLGGLVHTARRASPARPPSAALRCGFAVSAS